MMFDRNEQDVLLSAREDSQLWEVVASLRSSAGRGGDRDMILLARSIVAAFLDRGLVALRLGEGNATLMPQSDALRMIQQDDAWHLGSSTASTVISLTPEGRRLVSEGAIAEAERRFMR